MGEMEFSGVFNDSLQVVGKHWKLLVKAALLISILPVILLSAAYLIYYNGVPPEQLTAWDVVMSSIGWLLSLLLTLSVLEFLRARNRNLGHAVKAGAMRYWDGFVLTIVTVIALLFLFLLLIIPGIIFSVYWAFAYYALIMDDKSILGSLKHSWQIVRGSWWKVFGYLILISLILLAVSVVILLPIVIAGFMLALASPLLGALLIIMFSTAVDALMLVYLLTFMERMYVALR